MRQATVFAFVVFCMAVMASPVLGGGGDDTGDSDSHEAAGTERGHELGTLTVTAEKRDENIQAVPVSMTALSGFQIEDAGILSSMDLLYLVPNLHAPKAGNHYASQWLTIRGISPTGSHSGGASVGFYVDDVYYPSGVSTELFDVERIEVLRGPQGTLYGRNTEAGVINIITKKPGDHLGGSLSVSYGNYDTRNITGALGGPIVPDKLAFRVSGKYFNSDGFLENTFNGNEETNDLDDTNGRGQLFWTPTDALDISLVSEYTRYRDGFNCFVPLADARRNPGDISLDHEGHSHQDADTHHLKVVFDAADVSLTSVTSLRNWAFETDMDLDYSSFDGMRGAFDGDLRTISQEIRAASGTNTGGFKWLAGVYLFDENKALGTTYDYRTGMPGWGIPAFQQVQHSDIDATGYACFGQATLTLFQRLDITGGLRYDYEETSLRFRERYDKDLSGFGFVPSWVSPDEESYDEWLPKLSIAYRWTPDVMTYTSVTRGYTSGGYNIYVGQSANAGVPYDSQYSWNYEAGFKTTWLHRRLVVNAALFYIDWRNQHVVQNTPTGDIIFKNAAESTSKGIEIEVMARPLTGLELAAGFGYTDVTFDEYLDGGADYSGKTNPFVPEYTCNVSGRYTHPTGLFGFVEMLGTGPVYFDLANTEEEDAYTLVNARVGYEGEHFQLYLWAKNLFDETYISRAFENGPGYYIGCAGDPVTAGATVSVRY